ncbi:hypothetical protein PSHT_15696, partial [Puccinia striiformis]
MYSTSDEEGLVVDQIELKQDLICQLHSRHLPQLRLQVVMLSEALEPSRLLEDPSSKFKCILEIQSDINRTLDQIFFTTRTLCPLSMKAYSRANDQHLTALKTYRRIGLQFRLTELLFDDIEDLFDTSCNLIRELELTTSGDDDGLDVDHSREQLLSTTSRCLATIDSALTWANGSEFDMVQDEWRNEKRGVYEKLQALSRMIHPSNPSTKMKHSDKIKPLSGPVIQLAKTVVPIMKLSTLFFDKLSQRGMNRKRLPLFTKMCSYQLRVVGELAQYISGQLRQIVGTLKKADAIPRQTTSNELIKFVKQLETYFISGAYLILLHFVPIIPDTDGFPTQIITRIGFRLGISS